MSQRGAAEPILVVLLLVGVALHLGLRRDHAQRNLEYMPDMVDSPAYRAQEPNPNFADGATQRPPPTGTVARGFAPLESDGHLLVTDVEWEDMTPAQQAVWDTLSSPVDFASLDEATQSRLRARGALVFANVCATCHGSGGTGGSAATQRGVPLPPSLLDEKLRKLSDGHMFHVITFGKGAITSGKGNMAGHANQVTREDRWNVIRHVRHLQGETP